MPGICGYPAKGTGRSVNQGGTADSAMGDGHLFVLDREFFLSGAFFVYKRLFRKRFAWKSFPA